MCDNICLPRRTSIDKDLVHLVLEGAGRVYVPVFGNINRKYLYTSDVLFRNIEHLKHVVSSCSYVLIFFLNDLREGKPMILRGSKLSQSFRNS